RLHQRQARRRRRQKGWRRQCPLQQNHHHQLRGRHHRGRLEPAGRRIRRRAQAGEAFQPDSDPGRVQTEGDGLGGGTLGVGMAIPLTVKVYKGDQLVATKEYDRDIIKIGRLASAHLCLDDEKVSRVHSVIEVGAGGAISIVDMGSAEGTYLNGKRVNKGVVASGDEIRIGDTVIRIEPRAADAAPNLAEAATPQTAESGAPADSGEADPAVAAAPEQPAAAPLPDGGAKAQPAPRPAEASPTAAPPPREAPKPRPRSAKRSGPLGLELRFSWGDQIVGEFLLRPFQPKPFAVGSAEGVGFIVGDARLGGPRFEVIRPDREGFHLRFTPKMNGELVRGGAPTTLKQLTETRQATPDEDANSVLLQHGDSAWVDLGGVTLEVNFQAI